MSGTSYGACILHVSPESHVGGPLALLNNGDIIRMDLEARTIDMLVDDEELERRRSAWTKPADKIGRGYGWMFARHVAQADTGADFDFLETSFGPTVGEPDIY
jgi:dihydroxy-acid dehydratase